MNHNIQFNTSNHDIASIYSLIVTLAIATIYCSFAASPEYQITLLDSAAACAAIFTSHLLASLIVQQPYPTNFSLSLVPSGVGVIILVILHAIIQAVEYIQNTY